MPNGEQIQRAREIAETIRDQIRYGTTSNTGRTIGGVQAMMCWGARNFNSVLESKEWSGGLQFWVDGFKFSGLVQVLLTWSDTYTIKLDTEIKLTDIYFDQLTEVIDSLVEA